MHPPKPFPNDRSVNLPANLKKKHEMVSKRTNGPLGKGNHRQTRQIVRKCFAMPEKKLTKTNWGWTETRKTSPTAVPKVYVQLISNDILWASEMNQVRWYETIVRMQFIAIRSNRINQVWINSAMLSSSLSDTRMVTWTHLSSLQQRLAYSGEQSPKELRGNVTTQHPAMTKSKIFRMSRHTYPHLVRVRNTNQNTPKPLKPLVLDIEGAQRRKLVPTCMETVWHIVAINRAILVTKASLEVKLPLWCEAHFERKM